MTNHAESLQGRRLAGRVVIVTGGSGGIGRAVCLAAGAEGAAVVAVDLDAVGLKLVGDEMSSRSIPNTTIEADVSSERDVEIMAEQTLVRFGGIDALVACAGILRGRGCLPHPVPQVTLREWNQVLNINLTGVFLTNRAVIATMIAQRSGDIVNVSSTSGRTGRANDAAYCASKFGVIGFSEALGEEVRKYGVRVQTILPDAVDTPIWLQNGPLRPEQALHPARVADLVVFLIALPADTVISSPIIAPFRTRQRRPQRVSDEQTGRLGKTSEHGGTD